MGLVGRIRLASVVKYYGGETTQEKLRETSGTTLNGTSLLGLYQAAQKLGFGVGAFGADIKNLNELIFCSHSLPACKKMNI